MRAERMIRIQLCKDVGDIIVGRGRSSEEARVSIINDEVREEKVSEIMKSLVGYAKEFGFIVKAVVSQVESLKQKSDMIDHLLTG